MRSILIAGVLLLTALTFYSALWFKSETIEDDITKRVTADLDASGAANVDVDVDGRHVTLTGIVADAETETAYLDTADNTYGALGPIDGLIYQTDGGYVAATKDADGITLRGTVPTQDARADLVARATAATDGDVTDQLTVGGAAADWQSEAGFGIDKMAGLTAGALAVSSGAYSLSGTTDGDADDINGALSGRTGWTSLVTSDMSGKVADLTATVADRDQTIAGFQVELDSLRGVVGEEQADAATLSGQLATTQATLEDRDVTIADLTATVADRDVTIEGLTANVAGRDVTIGDLTATVAERDVTIEGLQGQLAANASDADAANNAKIAELTGQVSDLEGTVAQRDGTIVDLQGQLSATASEIEAANAAKIAALTATATAQTANVNRLSGEVDSLSAELENRDTMIGSLKSQLDAAGSDDDAIAALNGTIAERDATIADLNGQVGQIADLNGMIATKDATIADLTDQVANAGSNDGVIAELNGVIAERDATIAAFAATPASSSADLAAQCATQATAVLEGSRINFATGTANIDSGSVALLERVTGIALACVGDNVSVEIGGHTDDRGSEESNQLLSEQRAQAVRDFMTARGVDTSGLTAVGYGEANPIADNETAEGQAANRRISFDWQAR